MPRGFPGVVTIVGYVCPQCGVAFQHPLGKRRVYCSKACAVAGLSGQLLPRLLARIAVDANECWNWLGCRLSNGYGQISVRSRMVLTHRLAYELIVGPIPVGLQIDHLCRNRGCLNPAHLEPVPPRTNIARGDSPAAQRARWTRTRTSETDEEKRTCA